MTINIATVLEGLKEGQSPRTQKSLDKLNSILEGYHNEGCRDFSVTAIGRSHPVKKDQATSHSGQPGTRIIGD